MRVLIADDDRVSRRLLRAWLEKWGYRVTEAGNGEEALLELSREPAPSIAILDWMMPRMEGIRVCSEIRSRKLSNYCYVILLTAKGHQEDLIQGLDAGADDYIPKPFDPRELELRLRTARRIIGLQDALSAQNRKLEELAYIDSLTGLWNRRAIESFLRSELERARREQGSLSALMVDIDRFKQVNDRHGHASGDRVLQAVGRCLLLSSRPYDAIGRFGGEEFLVILPGCDLPSGVDIAERLRLEISQLGISLFKAHETLSVTASFGATSIDHRQLPISTERLLQAADSALYEAKNQGRNCVRSRLPASETETCDRGFEQVP